MNHCETCAHWSRDDGDGCDPNYGSCNACGYIGYGDENKPRTEMMYAWDCERYGAGLDTRCDFGCILHQPREERT